MYESEVFPRIQRWETFIQQKLQTGELTAHTQSQLHDQISDDWAGLGDELIVKYNDGFRNSVEILGEHSGYSAFWLNMNGASNNPAPKYVRPTDPKLVLRELPTDPELGSTNAYTVPGIGVMDLGQLRELRYDDNLLRDRMFSTKALGQEVRERVGKFFDTVHGVFSDGWLSWTHKNYGAVLLAEEGVGAWSGAGEESGGAPPVEGLSSRRDFCVFLSGMASMALLLGVVTLARRTRARDPVARESLYAVLTS